ncbi:intraflagellar transport-associated protein isoform X2 [Nyctibius grandis]|uniref:intraflagellar transport-associated protein isoform X2 n=1 Tax=Nyctibius grandis TaxID=48427 RepID=UPI0035BC36BD
MGEQLLNNSILDQFINSHEQSYEEFLHTFTYLLKEEEGKTIQGSKVDSLRKKFSNSELSNRNKQDGSPARSKEMWVSLPPQMPNENETMMHESRKAGGSDGNDLSLSERVKVDKYLDLEDTDTDEEACSGSLVLPGEMEQTMTYCTTVFDKRIQMKFRTLSIPQSPDTKAQEYLYENLGCQKRWLNNTLPHPNTRPTCMNVLANKLSEFNWLLFQGWNFTSGAKH